MKVSNKIKIELDKKFKNENLVKRILRTSLLLFYRVVFKKFTYGHELRLGIPLWLSKGSVKLGDYCYIGPRANVVSELVVGDMVLISSDFRVIGNDHGFNSIGEPMRISESDSKNIITYIENDVWVGEGVTLKQGVRIGRGAIVGVKSFVNKDVPPYAIVAGIPAKIIRYRFTAEEIKAHEDIIYSDLLK
ncbi:MAG: hypothetical protein RPR97_05375 [Colwellia sp.]|jgi:Acetyltransferase (isoleucine patch superfamily)